MASTSSLDHFFTASRHYLVAGASQDPTKFGHKVLKWYQAHSLPVTPLNPSRAEILGLAASPSITAFYNNNKNTNSSSQGKAFNSLAVSFVTAPNVTLRILDEIKQINAAAAKSATPQVEAVWFQPGSYNNSVLEAARAAGVPYVIAYDDCILVLGVTYLQKSKL
jgi:predicted CoA-binding protein